MELESLTVQKLNIDEFFEGKHLTIICVGKRGSGKSVLTRDILYHLHKGGRQRVVVFSQTEESNGFFCQFVPKIFVYNGLNLQRLTEIWENQKKLVKKQKVGLLSADLDLSLVIVLDDVAFDRKVLNSGCLKEIALNGRHSKVTIIITLQYIIQLEPVIRSNIDVGFFLNESIPKNRQRIFECFGGPLPSFRVFEKIFLKTTSNHESFCFLNCISSSDPSKIIKFYKANIDLDFRFGSPEMWRFNNRYAMSDAEEYKRDII